LTRWFKPVASHSPALAEWARTFVLLKALVLALSLHNKELELEPESALESVMVKALEEEDKLEELELELQLLGLELELESICHPRDELKQRSVSPPPCMPQSTTLTKSERRLSSKSTTLSSLV
jgi:hypothetical protein